MGLASYGYYYLKQIYSPMITLKLNEWLEFVRDDSRFWFSFSQSLSDYVSIFYPWKKQMGGSVNARGNYGVYKCASYDPQSLPPSHGQREF